MPTRDCEASGVEAIASPWPPPLPTVRENTMLPHTKKTLLVATCLLLAGSAVRSQALLTETFTAPTLAPLRWSVNAQCAPSGLVQPQNGECLLQDRAHLVSVAQFDPAQIGSYKVTCRWRWTDNDDSFMVLLRSDGVPDCANFGVATNGIEISTYMYAGAPWFGLGWRGNQLQLGAVTTSGPGGPVTAGVWYTATIVDTGDKVNARIDGPNGQWYSMEADVLQDTTTEKRISFHNREGGHQAFLDDVAVQLLPDWRQLQSPTHPSARYGAGLVFDESLGKALLFSGSENGATPADTWLHDGFTWQQQNPAQSPQGRFAFTMVHDSVRGQNVLFGGWNNSTRQNDTWIWSAGNWQQASPSGAIPPARDNHCAAFDRSRGRMVMFGGVDNARASLDDTWEWDGTQWSLMQTPVRPAGRGYATMTYDEARGKVVMYGGYDQSTQTFTDTWLWDGVTWTQASPATNPGPRNGAWSAYDSRRGVVVLGEGNQPSGWYSDTWEWDGTNWTQVDHPTQPPGRWYAKAAFNRIRGHVLTFGGITSPGSSDPTAWLDQTWAMEPHRGATYEPFGTGCAGPGGLTPVLAAAPGSAPRLGESSELTVSNLPFGLVCVPVFVLGVSREFDTGPFGPYLLPFSLAPFGWPNCSQLVSINDMALTITNSGQASYTTAQLPWLPILVGMQFHVQAIVLYDPLGSTPAVTNCLTGTAGY